jgi:phosphonate transport system permease protein
VHSLFRLIAAFFPPDLAPHYLLALIPSAVDSVGMAAAAMVIAFAVSLPLGLAAGTAMPGARFIQSILVALRAIPDLTLAIFCVVLVGIGPGAGTLALTIFYTAAVAKMFGDLFGTARRQPLEALWSAGASRFQVALFGLLPMKLSDLLTYGSYEFESAVRASVVVGAVGGGGLGSELVGTLNALDFRRAATLIIILVLVVIGIDRLTVFVRKRPRWLLALLPFALAAAWEYGPRVISVGHALHTFAGMFPPEMTAKSWHRLPQLLLETVGMAVGGTLFAAIGALPLGLASARNIAPAFIAVPVRRFLETTRSVPEVVWGLILVAVAGVGPFAGALALGLHSLGCLGRLYAESLENVPVAPVEAIAVTGASRFQTAYVAVFPLALGPISVHSLFRLEWNVRMATVMGMIGAGGIGQALYDAQQLFFYQQMIAWILITWILVAGFDWLSGATQRRFGLVQPAY